MKKIFSFNICKKNKLLRSNIKIIGISLDELKLIAKSRGTKDKNKSKIKEIRKNLYDIKNLKIFLNQK